MEIKKFPTLLIVAFISLNLFGASKNGHDSTIFLIQNPVIKDVWQLSSLDQVSLKGKVGQEIEKVLRARILSDLATEKILPEAITAFQKRVDDRIHPGRGLWRGEFWGKWMLSKS